MEKHKIKVAIRPHTSLRKELVHPKDKRATLDKSGVVYKIDCKTCKDSYIGETGRKLQTRINEHKKESTQAEARPYTRSARQDSLGTFHKSAITDHVSQQNCVIDWEDIRIIDNESDRFNRWIKESIHIRKHGKNCMNRDFGNYQLSHIWDKVISVSQPAQPKAQSQSGAQSRARRSDLITQSQ